ncbi:hypothetical protein PR003_g1260 [Phytophthora rubi]|uniref:Uncharacterized protein n=1 Tax=Phytophthora rubi TaxID=129364 RepID=A0A6A4FVW6_9STRA|nr:hypothetical protein PR002_g3897 [Phytophthora rubi]KAE9048749.1 hypothetical protein PR001_g3710 [Phytophthora rubi]KAE9358460.1 hypothetical protein PR003_g1260 [Phytophthora rubi]
MCSERSSPVVPVVVGDFMTNGFCGQMKKLARILERRYEESKQHDIPNKKSECVTCFALISGRCTGDVGKSNNMCKLCFGFVCRACRVIRVLSFADCYRNGR